MCFSLQGCYDEVTDKFEEYSWIIIGVLAGIIVLQVWECFTPPFLVLSLHILIALHLPSTPSNPYRTVFNSYKELNTFFLAHIFVLSAFVNTAFVGNLDTSLRVSLLLQVLCIAVACCLAGSTDGDDGYTL